MRHFATVIAVVLVLLALPALSAASAPAHSTVWTARPAASHPLATDGVNTLDQYGGYTTQFYTGYGSGQVYFVAFDPAGDATGVVQINDKNATRDGLANPVLSVTVNFSGGPYNYSTNSGKFYLIPFTLSLGGTWNVTIRATLGGFVSSNFTVHTYQVGLTPAQPVVLPGHSAALLYTVTRTPNGAPYAGLTALTVMATYRSGGNIVVISGTPRSLPVASIGEFNVTVPTAASVSASIVFVLWANVSANGSKSSEAAVYFLDVATLAAPTVSLSACPAGCFYSAYPVGIPLYLTIVAYSRSASGATAQPGLTVKLQFLRGTSVVVPPGGFPTTLTTNSTGGASVVFLANAPPFSVNQTNAVLVNITDPLNPGGANQSVRAGFNLAPAANNARLQVAVDRAQYYGGDVVTATWQLGGLNSGGAAGWTVDGWEAWEQRTNLLVGFGTINSAATTGSFAFPAPSGFGGTVTVTVVAHNQSSSLQAAVDLLVTSQTILLTPSEAYYLPGDTDTISVSTNGDFTGTTLYYTVSDSSGNLYGSGALTGNSIPLNVPTVATPDWISTTVSAESPTSGLLAKASLTVYLGSELLVRAGVDSKSNYADGSYQPGQTIQISYAVATVGSATLSKTFQVTICPGSSYFCAYGSTFIETSATSGKVSYKIPSNTPAGSQSFSVFVSSGSCGFLCYAGATFAIFVEPNPSVLQYELGAGSGVTVGWLILLVLILVLAVLGFLWLRRRDRPMVFRPEKPGGGGTTSSDAGPADSASSAWKEPDAGSSGSGGSPSEQPPLPTPK